MSSNIENKSTVHFTLGENAGKLLTQIAREQLLYQLDPNKAVETIQGSLIGCPTDIALKVLIGDIVLTVDKDGESINAIAYNPEMAEEFPKLDILQWSQDKVASIMDDGGDWIKCLREYQQTILDEDGCFDITIDYKQLTKYLIEGDFNELIHDNETISNLKCTMDGVKRFIEKSFKIISVINWLNRKYPNIIWEELTYEPVVLRLLHSTLTDFMNGNMDLIDQEIGKQKTQASFLETYFNAEREIEKTIKSGIMPVDITKGYDAGWLSPEGDYYAANGHIANMLHLQIADALKNKGVIPLKDKFGMDVNPDMWLEDNGWVKIHGSHILYTGYEQAEYGKPMIKLTDAQLKQIIQYGEKCCQGGYIQIGCTYKNVNVMHLKCMEAPMIAKLFTDF